MIASRAVSGTGSCWKPGRSNRYCTTQWLATAPKSASHAAGIASSFIFDQAMHGRLILVGPRAPRQSIVIASPW